MSAAETVDEIRPCRWQGRVFGSLTVLGSIGPSEAKRVRCRCTCGATVDATRWNLRTGRTKNCPACQVSARGFGIGARFGVLEVTGTVSLGVVKVKCDCGREHTVKTSSLTSERTRCSQDCILRRNAKKWLGQQFGRLTVTGLAERHLYLVCKCSCGKVVEAEASNLKSGRTQSCGSTGCRA